MQHVSIGGAASMLGVAVSTLRRWEQEERLMPDYRTPGGHRRYCIQSLLQLIYPSADPRKVVVYAGVSSHDQKDDLVRQKERLAEYCKKEDLSDYEIIDDLGSGLNYRKRGIVKLIRMICRGELSKLIIAHKDRLLRFGSEIVFELCRFHRSDVVILEEPPESFEQRLTYDVIELMTVFSARLYGARSHKNRKKQKEALVMAS